MLPYIASHRILAHGVFSHATMRFQGTRDLRDPSKVVTYCRRLALEEKNMEMLLIPQFISISS